MKPEELQRLRRREPFVPFRLVLEDGRTFDVLRRDLILLTQHSVTVGTEIDPANGLPEKTAWLSPSTVVQVVDLQAVA